MIEKKPAITQEMLLAGFWELGITPGSLVMVHSSLSAFGWVEGGAEAVVEALLEAVGPEGTLVMPALCQRDKERREETWDIAGSPSEVGRITETFRTWNPHPPAPSPGDRRSHGRGAGGEGPIRSNHFTHSVTALGPLAEEITAGHATAGPRYGPWGTRAFGHGSPWEKLYQHDALYCFLGVTFRVHTMRHYIQSLLLEEMLERAPQDVRSGLRERAADWNKPGLFPWWNGEQEEEALAARGLIKYVDIGGATCRSISARTAVDTIGRLVREQPEQWLDPQFLPWFKRAFNVGTGT